MVHYGKLLSELSAMDNELKENIEYLRTSRRKAAPKAKKPAVSEVKVPAAASAPTLEPLLPFLRDDSLRDDISGSIMESMGLLPLPESFETTFNVKQLPSLLTTPSDSDSPSSSSFSFLHRACQLFPKSTEVIEIALSSERTAVSTRVQMEAASPNGQPTKNRRKERYTYPINIALFHKASPEVAELLANAASDVLVLPDGRDGHTTLGIVLQLRSRADTDVEDSLCLRLVDILLRTNPACAHSVVDRRQNYPLHVACSKGAPLDVIERLHNAYPAAIAERNLAGETPLMIAQRYCACREDVLDYLQKKTWR